MNTDRNTANAGNILLILIAMVLGALIGVMFASHGNGSKEEHSTLQSKMGEVLDLLEDEYVDTIDADSLSEWLLQVVLSELDPHSNYLSALETARTDELMRGHFEGVGVVLHREGDTTFVGRILSDGPAEGSGLLPGDLVWAVDGVQVSGVGMPADSVVGRIRGPRRSTVELTVKRLMPGKPVATLTYKIRRGVVSHTTLPYSAMLNDTTGYILLTTFSTTSYEEFHDALQRLTRSGMRHLIFDLRGNTGGSLESAIGIANELLPAGSLIVYTQGAHQKRKNVYAQHGGLFTTGRVTVMVDEGSASASEVVSGALQDNDRATIVGRRTFGKGLVQREFELKDGSAVMLTVARYYTPSGRSIQRPYGNGTDEYYRDYVDQLLEESYADNPTLHVTDSTPYYTVGGRVVYGGGGIFPDRLLPYHKDSTLVYYNRLTAKGLLNRTAFALVRQHAAEWLKHYPDAETFCRRFAVDGAMEQLLVTMGEKEGVTANRRGLDSQRHLIRAMIKAYIGDFLYGEEAFYRVFLPEDEDLKRVLNGIK